MKKILILLLFLTLLTGCHDSITTPSSNIPELLYAPGTEFVVNVIEDQDLDDTIVYFAGVFQDEDVKKVMAFGYAISGEKYYRFGELECSDCVVLGIAKEGTEINLIFQKDGTAYVDLVYTMGGFGNLSYREYSLTETLASYLDGVSVVDYLASIQNDNSAINIDDYVPEENVLAFITEEDKLFVFSINSDSVVEMNIYDI